MHYYEGYSAEEIADYLRCPASTVRSRLARARKTLRNELYYAFGLFSIVFAKSENGKGESILASKTYKAKYRKVEITAKNILLKNKRRNKS